MYITMFLQGGKMYPERAVLYMALGEAQWITTYEEGTYDFWVSLNHVYNLDMSLLADHAVARYKGTFFFTMYWIISLDFRFSNFLLVLLEIVHVKDISITLFWFYFCVILYSLPS